ncbi:hypothetical protein AJ78_06469 [Emergomyces pasteurianus Ep9510]|uniref:HMA domain-containing protein n=1 Tax=Emergomyces pasteurianus Ep9510 TaxID=1447872 RepID=A0A1J9P945_9EURO|nr:hypothetical protein AJ78_06469 [Emergomyces pasteurianus Ep9510]
MSAAEKTGCCDGDVRDDSSSLYSRSSSVRKADCRVSCCNRQSREIGGGAGEVCASTSGRLCCDMPDGDQDQDRGEDAVGACCKEKATDDSVKRKQKEQPEQPSCSKNGKNGTCSRCKGPPSRGPSSPISDDDGDGLEASCCSGHATVWPTYSVGRPSTSASDANLCCKTGGECECSDECLIEYAAYLCSMDGQHSGDPVPFPEGERCCTQDNSPTLPRERKRDSLLHRLSFPANFQLPPRHPNHRLGRTPTRKPCARHLNMASEYATGTAPKGDDTASSTFSRSGKAAEVNYVSNIGNIMRRCFCRGPRRLVFPDEKSCCVLSRERKQSLLEDGWSCLKPSTDQIDIVVTPPKKQAPELDIEKGIVNNLYSLSLGVVGMTCTGCESKLRNILNSYLGVSEVRTSFMLNRADLLYNSSIVSDPAEIVSRIKKVAGFTCTILRTGLASGDAAGERICIRNLNLKGLDAMQQIDGISYVTPLRDGTHELIYNPQTIGVRDILDAANSHPGTHGAGHAELAPDCASEDIAQATANAHWFRLVGRTVVATILTIPVLVFAWAPVARYAPFPKQTSFISSSFALATVVQLLAIPIYKHAFRSLVYQREIDMDVLVVLSITSAYIYSVVSFAFEIRLSTNNTVLGHPIFETSSLLVTLILLGRLMAASVRRKAHNAIKLGTSQPKSARVVRKASSNKNLHARPFFDSEDNQPEFIDSSLLHYGDIIQGKASENIVTDGIVVDGSAEMDEAHITGENEPVVRTKKAYVYAGSTIINGQINYRVMRLVSENTLSIVKRLVSTAASSRTRTLERADLAASYLTPIILVVACTAFLIWVLINRFVRDWADTKSSINALTHAIAILAISCPCALALAVPMVLTVAGTVGAKKGVLFKAGAALEVGCKISHVVFDKTGTLTSGDLVVIRETLLCEAAGKTCQEISRMAAMVTEGNRHPVSLAITQYLASNSIQTDATAVESSKIIIGKGVEITTEKGTIKGGSPAWLGVETHPKVKELLDESLTTFCVVHNHVLLAVYGLTGSVRPEAAEVLRKLHSKKITTHLLSGDNPLAVSAVAINLNFNMDNVRSLCQPENKAAYIRDLQASITPSTSTSTFTSRLRLWPHFRSTSSKPKVLFVGDGTNDAPALSQADLGICMTNATDIAADAADVGILSGSLCGLLTFLDLSQRATRRIQINIAWAVLYNLFAVLFAGGAFEAVGFRIEPSYAGAGEMVSLVPVIVVSLSLGLSWRFIRRYLRCLVRWRAGQNEGSRVDG